MGTHKKCLSIGLDKSEYQVYSFLIAQQKHVAEALLMSTTTYVFIEK